jgi:hypothetical protein
MKADGIASALVVSLVVDGSTASAPASASVWAWAWAWARALITFLGLQWATPCQRRRQQQGSLQQVAAHGKTPDADKTPGERRTTGQESRPHSITTAKSKLPTSTRIQKPAPVQGGGPGGFDNVECPCGSKGYATARDCLVGGRPGRDCLILFASSGYPHPLQQPNSPTEAYEADDFLVGDAKPKQFGGKVVI